MTPVAVDGKTLRGARRENGTKVQLLSAFLHQQGATVAQIEIDQKINEIPELRQHPNPNFAVVLRFDVFSLDLFLHF